MSGISSNRSSPTSHSADSSRDSPVAIGDNVEAAATVDKVTEASMRMGLLSLTILYSERSPITSLNALPAGVATTDGGESVPSAITTAGRTNRNSHSGSNTNFESTLENIAVSLGNYVKEDRERRLEDRKRGLEERMDAISAEKRKVRRLIIESRQEGNDELHECYKQELNELDSKERRIQEILETL
ncbi:hypothetical protein IV203_023687 [Nitzschia inconspicua]|uniref:Uncharacterized protein n=1 Tax=Nitzschia inconspicua TaxID=303405 RepID=A0A9K3KDH1_9STRA|nr:hypothetical protein IV203_023687 [Nitzschia inconspicua]